MNQQPNQQYLIWVLAKRRAKIRVKDNLKARGVKLSYIPNREIYEMAEDYLIANRAELFATAALEYSQIFGQYTKHLNARKAHSTGDRLKS